MASVALSLSFGLPTCNLSSLRSLDSASNKAPRVSNLSLRIRCSSLIVSRVVLMCRLIGTDSRGKTTFGMVKTSAWRDGGEERFQALEHEAFVNGPSEQGEGSVVVGGIEATANRLSKWIVSALFGCILLLRHDGAALWAVIGSISNSALSFALKRILNLNRPVPNLRSDPGMPSSHAQSISYISVFAILSVLEWLGINQVSLFLSGLILASGSYFTWLRVSQKLHTVSQVVVGAILGSVFCILWYLTWNSVVFEAFASSFIVEAIVFSIAAAFGLAFAAYVVRNWFS